MFLNEAECRYLLRLIAENTDGNGYANPDELVPGTDQPIGRLQAKLSIMLEAASKRRERD